MDTQDSQDQGGVDFPAPPFIHAGAAFNAAALEFGFAFHPVHPVYPGTNTRREFRGIARLALPDRQDLPSGSPKLSQNTAVPFLVSLSLLAPIRGVLDRRPPAVVTCVKMPARSGR
jgi:hypothetical protein